MPILPKRWQCVNALMNFGSGVGESPSKDKRRGRTESVVATANTVSLKRTSRSLKPIISPTPRKPAYPLVSLRVDSVEITRGHGMGEWKAQVSFRVRQAFRDELAAFAAQEK